MGDNIGSFRYINLLNQSNQPHYDHPFPDLEFDDADVVFYSSTVDSPYGYHYQLPPSTVDHNRRFGLSALLADNETESMVATSPQPMLYFAHPLRTGPHQSAPQAIPTWHFRTDYHDDDDEDVVFDQEETEMVPPHVMVAQSHTPTALSVLEGAGRTLKGRDLCRVRNAVLQKTGFLDLRYES